MTSYVLLAPFRTHTGSREVFPMALSKDRGAMVKAAQDRFAALSNKGYGAEAKKIRLVAVETTEQCEYIHSRVASRLADLRKQPNMEVEHTKVFSLSCRLTNVLNEIACEAYATN